MGRAPGYTAHMPTDQSEVLLDALKRVSAILREEDIEFLLGGGMAAWARGGPPTEHDIDFVIREADAERNQRLSGSTPD